MKNIVVIGNGMVGHKFCQLWSEAADPQHYSLTVFGEEPVPAYDRIHLSEYFSGKTARDLELSPAKWYADCGIALRTGELIVSVERDKKQIKSSNGDTISYDYLVFATGSAPFVPKISGIQKRGVLLYRTLEDLDAIMNYANQVRDANAEAAVMGGGLLGLEAAKALKDLGLTTHVIEYAPYLMPRQLDEEGGDILRSMIETLGIKVHLACNTTDIYGSGRIDGMTFDDGRCLEVGMLVVSAGIRPRDELAHNCGLEIGQRGGIVVNNHMQTSDPSIWAIGEVASFQDMTYGLAAPGFEMAEVALHDIMGKEKTMPGMVDQSTKLKLLGVDVATFGEATATGDHVRTIAYTDRLSGTYKRINLSGDGRRLLGGILVGDADDYNMLLQIQKNGLALPPNPEDLILTAKGAGSALGSVMDLPDDALICSCESVEKSTICTAISDGSCSSLKAVCSQTKAATGCGGCKPMVADLVKGTLASLGKTVKESICEHFDNNRRELYDLILIEKVKTFDEAITRFGSGHGCEICKPVLASIFAGIYAETAVKQETIQDTNDRFLANIQRNGTYSVIPRVPGGEITPEQLIVIGQVAKKYSLYTKITGGQRIDMFGARVDQLPLIWEELIAAGFESGHAYGKALRTVKSCVGSTWCRFGMDESISFAIELEDRYRGIRSPHKLKGGVSGCIRECAEARCKDFGLIATEGGWNLYICGNGGANPRHAVLFAEGIDKETSVRYIDRFLMFYIRTAPPLTRTAPWLEKLDGGLAYLKRVIIEDELGICDTLGKEMNGLVGRYQCEWKQVVESPALKERFRHFVNSDSVDDNIEFIPMRGQKMPRRW